MVALQFPCPFYWKHLISITRWTMSSKTVNLYFNERNCQSSIQLLCISCRVSKHSNIGFVNLPFSNRKDPWDETLLGYIKDMIWNCKKKRRNFRLNVLFLVKHNWDTWMEKKNKKQLQVLQWKQVSKDGHNNNNNHNQKKN